MAICEAEGKCAVEKTPKHVIITDAIQRLQASVRGLEELVEKVRGDDSAKTLNPDSNIPSLVDVLVRTPDDINEVCDRISQVYRELNELLF